MLAEVKPRLLGFLAFGGPQAKAGLSPGWAS
jgi:hypothetical protein